MRILHHKKTKGTKTDVEISLDAALDPKNFATYTTEKDGKIEHVGVAWLLPVVPGSQSYEGHRFELLMLPAELDRLEGAIKLAKERFAQAVVPGNVEAVTDIVKADAEG